MQKNSNKNSIYEIICALSVKQSLIKYAIIIVDIKEIIKLIFFFNIIEKIINTNVTAKKHTKPYKPSNTKDIINSKIYNIK